MHVDLDKREKLALANIKEVKAKLESDGYYLQMPPTQDELAQLIAASEK